MSEHPVQDWEFILGDKHYSMLEEMITPYRQPNRGHQTDEEYYISAIISFYRARIEHVNHRIEVHPSMKMIWSSSVGRLRDYATVLIYMTNIELKLALKYHPLGPWPHVPNQ